MRPWIKVAAREIAMLAGFGVAAFIVSTVASFALGLLGALLGMIPFVGDFAEPVLKLGEKIVGGLLAIPFAWVAAELRTVGGVIGALVGSASAVLLLAFYFHG